MGKRRQAREIALQALYMIDTAGTPVGEAFASVTPGGPPDDPATLDFARALVEGASGRREDLDGRIEATAENWSVPRMAAVDRNVLRLAAFELLYRRETPVGVVIDEAIEIARKFSTEEATKFINGILDKIKEKRADADGDPQKDRR